MLTMLTIINVIMFNSKTSGYISATIGSLAYALILTLANQLEYPYLGPLSAALAPLYLLFQRDENSLPPCGGCTACPVSFVTGLRR